MKRLIIAFAAAAALVTGCAHRETGSGTTETGTTTGTGQSAQPTQGDAAGRLSDTNSPTGTATNGTVNPNSDTNTTVNPDTGSSTPDAYHGSPGVSPSGVGSGSGPGFYRL